jgi:hypothetical protein
MSRFPWQRGWRPTLLDARLYPVAARLATEGRIPLDHPVWRQTVRSTAAYDAEVNQPDDVPALRRQLGERLPDDTPTLSGGAGGSCSCGTRWTGLNVAHCAVCHLTFFSVNGFDEHRIGGRCRTEAELSERGLEPNDKGWWRRPRPIDSLPERS